ncbi:MAG: SAM-dependent DNA methyltransferase [Desulfobacteraceae bacterium]|nr:MAG: SAM-dependent DNA methyltransferase [Desulfobacteraceae bacterium]
MRKLPKEKEIAAKTQKSNTWNDAFNGKVDNRRQEVQQAVKSACDQLNSDGVNPRDYVEQLAWLFFLKAFDEMETRREEEAAFDDIPYARRLEGKYRFSEWAAMTDRPDDMLKFVNGELWEKLTNLGADSIAEKFRRIFTSVRNHSRRGASFARVVQQVNRLHFSDATDVIVLSEIYEGLLKDVASDSAGYAGEFYTQRHIVRAMVEVVKPKLGDKVYDPCFGTAGFLAESADYVRRNAGSLSLTDLEKLDKETFYGFENKPLTYLLGIMNMLLHRIEGANLELANTLEVHSANVPEKNRYDVILSNPPYGGKMARELQTNFTIRSGSTEILFLQHIMANLAKGGRAGVIIPEGVLFRGGPDARVRERLLTEFDVHTILSLPAGCFLPYTGVKTNILFFNRSEDGRATDSVWYYELINDGFELKQTRRPMEGSQIPDFLKKWEKRTEGENSWTVPISEIREKAWDLSARNPNRKEDNNHRPALELVQSIKAKEERILELLGELEEMLEQNNG